MCVCVCVCERERESVCVCTSSCYMLLADTRRPMLVLKLNTIVAFIIIALSTTGYVSEMDNAYLHARVVLQSLRR